MDKINLFDSVSSNELQTNSIANNSKQLNRIYAFTRKVARHFISPRNCLMFASSAIAGTISGAVAFKTISASTNEDNKCNPDNALSLSLFIGLNAMASSFLCVALFSILDASEPKKNDSVSITTAEDSIDKKDIEKQNNFLIENKSIVNSLLKQIKTQIISIKNKLKNIDQSEAFVFFILMAVSMLILSLSEYFSLPEDSCRGAIITYNIITTALSFLIFSLPIMAIKKYEGMSIS